MTRLHPVSSEASPEAGLGHGAAALGEWAHWQPLLT